MPILLLSGLFGLASAGIGVGQQCCEIAKGAFQNGTLLVRPNNYVCGQSYNESSGPAPDLAVPLSWCQDHCP